MRKSIERGDSEVGVGPTTPAHADRRKDRSGLIDVSARDWLRIRDKGVWVGGPNGI